MPDPSITIPYSISAITSNTDGTSLVTYTMTHSGTSLSSTRTDTFQSADLAKGVNTTADSGPTKVATLKLNFEALAKLQFMNFAAKVRAAQAISDITNIDPATGSVTNLSIDMLVAIHGSVTI